MHPVQTQLIIFVEVVGGEHTSDETVTTTMRFCGDVDLRAVLVRKEIPGFLWNRVWFALLREMLHLVDIGAADPLKLDSMVQTTLRAFVPVFGPLQMTDLIGHDTLRDISNALYPELAADRTASTTIEQHVKEGRLGVKNGRGFYDDSDQRVAELTSKLYQIALQLGHSTGLQAIGAAWGRTPMLGPVTPFATRAECRADDGQASRLARRSLPQVSRGSIA